jgi:hypothetical protein
MQRVSRASRESLIHSLAALICLLVAVALICLLAQIVASALADQHDTSHASDRSRRHADPVGKSPPNAPHELRKGSQKRPW